MNKKALWLLSLLAMVPFLVSGAYEWLCQTVCDGTILAVIWMGVLLLAALCHTPFGKRPVDDEMNRQKLRIIKDTGIALLLSCLLCLVALILGKTLTALGIREELPSYHIIALSVILLGVLLFFLYAQYSKPCASPHTGTPANEEPTNTTSPNENNHDGILLTLLLIAAVGCQILTPLPMHLLFLTAFALLEIHVLMPGLPPSIPQPGNDLIDLLGREKVVRDCAERLKTPKKRTGEACNLALTGSWGSGKTFIMKLVHHELQKDQDIHVIPLNLWHLQTLADIHKAVIQAIYSTVRAPSCFSSPALLWCLRSIANLCDAQSSTRFSEALERLVLNPGSMHTAGDVAALNAAIRKPVIIFFDDLERLNKNVLEQVLPMIDSLSQVNKLRFFVAINTETFNEFKTTRTEAAGYFHKVFTDHIELPSIQEEYYGDFIHELLVKNHADRTSQRIITSIFNAKTHNCPLGIAAYYPIKVRTLIHSIGTLVYLCKNPLSKLILSPEDHDECKKTLSLYHFINSIKEENPDFYRELKALPSSERITFLEKTIKNNSTYSRKEGRKIWKTYKNYRPLRFLLENICMENKTRIYFAWSTTNFEYVLGGVSYSILYPSTEEILNAFNLSFDTHTSIHFDRKRECEENFLIRTFWDKIIHWVLGAQIPPSASKYFDSSDNKICLIIKNSEKQIRKNSDIFVPILRNFLTNLGTQNETVNLHAHTTLIAEIAHYLRTQEVIQVLEIIDMENSSHHPVCSALTKELKNRVNKILSTRPSLASTKDLEELTQDFAHIPDVHMPSVLGEIEVDANTPKHVLMALAISWYRALRSTYHYLMEPEKGQKRYLDSLFYKALHDAFPNQGTDIKDSSLQHDVTELLLQHPDYKDFFKFSLQFSKERNKGIPTDRQKLIDELKAMLDLVMPKPETGQ